MRIMCHPVATVGRHIRHTNLLWTQFHYIFYPFGDAGGDIVQLCGRQGHGMKDNHDDDDDEMECFHRMPESIYFTLFAWVRQRRQRCHFE